MAPLTSPARHIRGGGPPARAVPTATAKGPPGPPPGRIHSRVDVRLGQEPRFRRHRRVAGEGHDRLRERDGRRTREEHRPKGRVEPGDIGELPRRAAPPARLQVPQVRVGLVAVPPPGTSQTCPECRTRDPQNRPGCGRAFACVACGYQDHADRVAALNIERRAVAILAAGPAVRSTGRRKPRHGPKAVGGPVKQVAPVLPRTGRAESRVA